MDNFPVKHDCALAVLDGADSPHISILDRAVENEPSVIGKERPVGSIDGER
jgi:hypothetical protein